MDSKSSLSIQFKAISFNTVQNHNFQQNSNPYISTEFKIIFANIIQNHIIRWNSNNLQFYETALHLATKIKNVEIVKILLANQKYWEKKKEWNYHTVQLKTDPNYIYINFIDILNISTIKNTETSKKWNIFAAKLKINQLSRMVNLMHITFSEWYQIQIFKILSLW